MAKTGSTGRRKSTGISNPVTVSYYTIQDVKTILGCGRTKACSTIRELNDELEKMGYMRYPQGRVPKKYFDERFNLAERMNA